MLKGKTVSVIIPIFNEEKTLRGVVETALECSFVDQVIAVNDGSTDQSLTILKSFGKKIKLINQPKNLGKGNGLADGILAASGEIVVFLDADLIGLKPKHLQDLITPVASSQVKVGWGILEQDINQSLKKLTGQRAYLLSDLLPLVDNFRHSRYGVEIYLNHAFKKVRRKEILWRQVGHLSKYKKHSPQVAFEDYLKSGLEIGREYLKVNNLLTPELERKITNLGQSKSLKELKVRIQKIKNIGLRSLLEEFVTNYSQRIKTLLK